MCAETSRPDDRTDRTDVVDRSGPGAEAAAPGVRRVADDPALGPSLAMVLDRAFTPHRSPTRSDLLWSAMTVWAPPDLVRAIGELPDRRFWSGEEVTDLLVVPA